MSTQRHNFRIGLFVLLGVCLFIGALLAMGVRSYFGKRDLFETYVTGKVENLSVGALVMLRGVAVGKVSSINFVGSEYPGYKEEYVVVQFEIPHDFRWTAETTNLQAMLNAEIDRGLRARVQGQGFLGANIVSLEYVDPKMYPVEPVPWAPKHYYIPSAPNQFNRVFTSLERTLRHVEDIDTEQLLARIQKTIDSASELIANLNRIDFNQIGTNANSLIAEFHVTNRGLQKTLADAQKTLADAQNAINGANVPEISRNTVALEDRLSATVTDLRRQLSRLDLAELNESLANVRAATDELTTLLHRLNQRPSSVLFSKSPPPVSEMAPPGKK